MSEVNWSTIRAWRAHRVTGAFVAVVLAALPLLASLVAASTVAGAVDGGMLPVVVAIVVGAVTALVVRRGLVWAMPLPALYRLSCAFPDRLPSRFAVALRAGAATHRRGAPPRVESLEQAIELVAALTRHDPRLRGHSERVRAYTDLIAAELRIPTVERERLGWAALLHDVGKLAVPRDILDKTTRLTNAEWRVLRSHAEVGQTMVEPIAPLLGPWAAAVGEHHERWDGSGYPNGLAGCDISHAGRIVAVADAFDVMTSNRSYQRARSLDEARDELLACAGTQFDPDVVRAFLAIRLPALRAVVGLPAVLVAMLATIRQVLEQSRLDKIAAPAGAGAGAAAAAIVIGALSVDLPPPPAAKPTVETTTTAAPPATTASSTTTTTPATTTTIPPDNPPALPESDPPAEPTPTTSPQTAVVDAPVPGTTAPPPVPTTPPPAPRPPAALRTPLPTLTVTGGPAAVDVRALLVDPGDGPLPTVEFGTPRLGTIERDPDGNPLYRPRPNTVGFDRVTVRLPDRPDLPPAELGVVVNGPPGAPRLTVATSPQRLDAGPLAGTLPGVAVAVTVEPGDRIVEARFHLDDPDHLGPPRQIERVVAFDFGGTEADGSARLVLLPPGRHTLSVDVELVGGERWRIVHELDVPAPAGATVVAAPGGA